MGSHHQTLMMKTFLVLLMITALVSANPRNQKHGKKGKGENVKREGRHEGEHVKVQRVWHVAESEEQCGDEAAEIHQHDVKPHELCTEVNTTISICVTRDTEVVEDESEVEEAAEETNEVAVDGEAEEEAEVEFAPKEGADWEFRTGTCAFRLIMENEDDDEERSQIVKKNKKKQMKRKMKAKDNNKKENTKSRARRVRNKNNNKNKA